MDSLAPILLAATSGVLSGMAYYNSKKKEHIAAALEIGGSVFFALFSIAFAIKLGVF